MTGAVTEDLLPRARRFEPPLRALTSWFGIFAVVVSLATVVGSYTRWMLRDLPAPGRPATLAESILVYDRTGHVLGEQNPGGELHVTTPLGRLGRYGPAATLAAEDRDFYRHGSIDSGAITRAALVDLAHGRAVEGGSTITQQLVKLDLLTPSRTLTRKVHEGFLAWALERRYTKDQILELYLNRVYYGHHAYGLTSAVKAFFGADRQPADLTPAQAALLAGLIRAPSGYDPAINYPAARDRELYVLRGMVSMGVLTTVEEQQAEQEDVQSELRLSSTDAPQLAPQFFQYVLRQLEERLGPATVQQGGLEVHTTLDPTLQGHAVQAVREGVAGLASMNVNNGDLLAVRPGSGDILAWVGSADFHDPAIGGQYDVIGATRQPGSSFKPYVYEAALRDRRITLCTTVHDVPTDFGGYRPMDFDQRFMGPMTAEEALVLSRNVPAVAVARYEGIDRIIALAHDMGVQTPLQPYLSTALGSSEITMLDQVQGYSVFANQGRRVPLNGITRVVARDGTVLYDRSGGGSPSTPVLTAPQAYLITDALKEYQRRWSLGWNIQMASKSGTTNRGSAGHPDAWMMAYNPDIVVGTWAGNTAPGGGGGLTDAFGTDVGRNLLGRFINSLPPGYDHWYPTPPGITTGREGIPYLAGTQDAGCTARRGPLPQPGADQPPPRGHGHGEGHGGD